MQQTHFQWAFAKAIWYSILAPWSIHFGTLVFNYCTLELDFGIQVFYFDPLEKYSSTEQLHFGISLLHLGTLGFDLWSIFRMTSFFLELLFFFLYSMCILCFLWLLFGPSRLHFGGLGGGGRVDGEIFIPSAPVWTTRAPFLAALVHSWLHSCHEWSQFGHQWPLLGPPLCIDLACFWSQNFSAAVQIIT